MLYEEERKSGIAEYIHKNSRASVEELSEKFNVSKSTIRRDLQELEDVKLLKRTHGGAVSLEMVSFESAFTEREDKYAREKELIAKRAAELIQDGDTIILDAGTTTQLLAREIKGFSGLTVVTNSLMIAYELQNTPNIEVMVTGGKLRPDTLSLVGPLTEEALKHIRVNICFVATNALDIAEGLTTPMITEATAKRKMMEIAKQVILLADHTKIGKVSFAKFADLTEIDQYIVDDGISEEMLEALEKMDITVHVASENRIYG
jgi:DeoR family fructose operon transcriptional repressor